MTGRSATAAPGRRPRSRRRRAQPIDQRVHRGQGDDSLQVFSDLALPRSTGGSRHLAEGARANRDGRRISRRPGMEEDLDPRMLAAVPRLAFASARPCVARRGDHFPRRHGLEHGVAKVAQGRGARRVQRLLRRAKGARDRCTRGVIRRRAGPSADVAAGGRLRLGSFRRRGRRRRRLRLSVGGPRASSARDRREDHRAHQLPAIATHHVTHRCDPRIEAVRRVALDMRPLLAPVVRRRGIPPRVAATMLSQGGAAHRRHPFALLAGL